MIKRISIILLLPLLLCGCSESEIENTAIVVGAGIDVTDGEIELTVETVNTPENGKDGAKGSIFTCRAKTVALASAKMAAVAGRPLYWDHLKLIVISPDALEQKLDELLEWLMRSAHSRIDTPIALCEKSAKETLNSHSGEGFAADTLFSLIDAAHKNGYTVKKAAYIIFNELESKSEATLLPYIRLENEKPEVAGSVAVGKGRIRAYLNESHTLTALLLTGKLEGGQEVIDEASFSISGVRQKSKIEISGAKALLLRDIKITLRLEEIADSSLSKDKLNLAVKESILKSADDVLRLSKSTGCDFLLLKEELYRKRSDIYGYIDEISTDISISIKTDSHGQSKYEGGANE